MLDQLRERIRYLHYSVRTERAYVHWVRSFIATGKSIQDVSQCMTSTASMRLALHAAGRLGGWPPAPALLGRSTS